MSRRFVPSLFVAALLLASACSGSSHHPQAAGPAQPAPSSSASGNPLNTTVQYSGVFDEKIHEDITGDNVTQTQDDHVHFSFRESVSLTTPAAALARPIQGTSAISDSIDNPVTFQLSGTLSEHRTSSAAPPLNCESTLSGNTGLDKWSQISGKYSTNRPPVEIAVDARDPAGGVAKTYGLQISAEVPNTGPHGRVIKIDESQPSSDNFCEETTILGSQAVQASPDCIKFAAPGPVDANFLLLPLDTENYRQTFSCDKTLPLRSQGITGTDIVSGSGTLTVNPSGGAYVALGDSFTTGDFPPFQDEKCGRSEQAYPVLYDSKVDFLACAGYASTAIAQLSDQIPASAKVISVTAGGDDMHIFALMAICIQHQIYVGSCEANLEDNFHADITLTQVFADVESNLSKMFKAIKDSKAGPDAKVYALAYPDPLPSSYTPGTCPALENSTFMGVHLPIGVANKDLGFFKAIIGRLNVAIATTSAGAGATYIPADPSFAQHTVCSVDPWFFRLDAPGGEPLHPNEAGHRELEQELFASAGPAPD